MLHQVALVPSKLSCGSLKARVELNPQHCVTPVISLLARLMDLLGSLNLQPLKNP